FRGRVASDFIRFVFPPLPPPPRPSRDEGASTPLPPPPPPRPRAGGVTGRAPGGGPPTGDPRRDLRRAEGALPPPPPPGCAGRGGCSLLLSDGELQGRRCFSLAWLFARTPRSLRPGCSQLPLGVWLTTERGVVNHRAGYG